MDKRGQEGMKCPHHDSGPKKILDFIKNTVKNTFNKIECDGGDMNCRIVDVVLPQKRELSKEEIHAKRKEAIQSANNAYKSYQDVYKRAQEEQKIANQAQSGFDKHFENMKSKSNKISESIKEHKVEQKKLDEKFGNFAGKIEKKQREVLNDALNSSLTFMKEFINDIIIDRKVINASSDQIRDIIEETQGFKQLVDEYIQFMNIQKYSTKQEKEVLITLNAIKDLLENKVHQPLEKLLPQVDKAEELEKTVQEEAIKAQEGFREKANEAPESLLKQENLGGVVLLPKSPERMENSQELADKANEEAKRSRIEIENLLSNYDENIQSKLYECMKTQEISYKYYLSIINKRKGFKQGYDIYIKSIKELIRANMSNTTSSNKYGQNVNYNYKNMRDSILDYNKEMHESDLKDLCIGEEVLESLHAIDKAWKELLPLVKQTREAKQEALDLKREAKDLQKEAKEYEKKYREQMRKYAQYEKLLFKHNEVSSQESGANPLVNLEQMRHGESSSATFPQNSEKVSSQKLGVGKTDHPDEPRPEAPSLLDNPGSQAMSSQDIEKIHEKIYEKRSEDVYVNKKSINEKDKIMIETERMLVYKKGIIEEIASATTGYHKPNEDSCFISECGGGVFDGVSQGGRGAEASQMAKEFFKQELPKLFSTIKRDRLSSVQIEAELKQITLKLNSEIKEKLNKNTKIRALTTLALVMPIGDGKMMAVNVGDSRVYVLSKDGKLNHITTDDGPFDKSQYWNEYQESYGFSGLEVSKEEQKEIQTKIANMNDNEFRKIMEAEDITEEDLKIKYAIDYGYVLSQYLGIDSVKPNIVTFDINHDDRVIIISDGIYDNLSAKEMIKCVLERETAKDATWALVKTSRENSLDKTRSRYKSDDATAVVIKYSRKGGNNV